MEEYSPRRDKIKGAEEDEHDKAWMSEEALQNKRKIRKLKQALSRFRKDHEELSNKLVVMGD
jgi:hypothetical protein